MTESCGRAVATQTSSTLGLGRWQTTVPYPSLRPPNKRDAIHVANFPRNPPI